MERIENYNQLVKIIREAMNRRGVTQTELAKALKVKQPQINRVLTFKNSPSVDFVFEICNYLKISIAAACPTVSINEESVL